jgi:hypothetical protein
MPWTGGGGGAGLAVAISSVGAFVSMSFAQPVIMRARRMRQAKSRLAVFITNIFLNVQIFAIGFLQILPASNIY